MAIKLNTVEQLRKDADCVVIEHDNPTEVRIVSLTEGFEADDMFNSMIETIERQGFMTKSVFTDCFLSRIKKRSENKKS